MTKTTPIEVPCPLCNGPCIQTIECQELADQGDWAGSKFESLHAEKMAAALDAQKQRADDHFATKLAGLQSKHAEKTAAVEREMYDELQLQAEYNHGIDVGRGERKKLWQQLARTKAVIEAARNANELLERFDFDGDRRYFADAQQLLRDRLAALDNTKENDGKA